MQVAELQGLAVHYADQGPRDGRAVVFGNSLGTDLRVWDAVLPLLPQGLRLVRYDKRGHGLTQATPGPYSIGQLADDAAALMDHLGLRDAVFVGLSIGGLIGQSLAARRPDLLRGLVLSNTAAKIGTPELWRDRIATIRAGGIEAIGAATMERWFSPAFRETTECRAWQMMLERLTALPVRAVALEAIEGGTHGLGPELGPLVVICERGARSGLAARFLQADGLDAAAYPGGVPALRRGTS